MNLIGLLGGMSWESTAHYYRVLNETVRDRLGGMHSAPIVMHSVDFAQIRRMQEAADWASAGELLGAAARGLADSGASFIVMATNTMHVVADEIEAAAGIPLLHIADPTADAILAADLTTVGLLGTRFTMEMDFYRERLEARGLTVITPSADDRLTVDRIIFDELVHGVVTDASRDEYRAVIRRLVAAGAQGVILGCTEITMLVGPADSAVPLFDTTELHAVGAVARALEGNR